MTTTCKFASTDILILSGITYVIVIIEAALEPKSEVPYSLIVKSTIKLIEKKSWWHIIFWYNSANVILTLLKERRWDTRTDYNLIPHINVFKRITNFLDSVGVFDNSGVPIFRCWFKNAANKSIIEDTVNRRIMEVKCVPHNK